MISNNIRSVIIRETRYTAVVANVPNDRSPPPPPQHLLNCYFDQTLCFLWSSFWLGVTHFDTNGDYRDLMTYGAAPYTNWEEGEPDDDTGSILTGDAITNHDCVTMDKTNGRWSDNVCNTAYGLVCQVLPHAGINPLTRRSFQFVY